MGYDIDPRFSTISGLSCLKQTWRDKITIEPAPEGWGLLGDCWLYNGALNHDGYPIVRVGFGRKDSKLWLLHRWVAFNVITPDIKGKDVDHLCLRRNCIQPLHLLPCSHEQNLAHMHQRLHGFEIVQLSNEDLAALADGSWLT